MPYKDPEVRRRYDREYKRRIRAQQGLVQPGQTPGRKAYICLRFPHLPLSGLAFRDGWFITADPQEQATIEQDQAYGQFIFSWRVEPYLSWGWLDCLTCLTYWGAQRAN